MKSKSLFLLFSVLATLAFMQPALAQEVLETTNLIEELNPFDPNIEETLSAYDEEHERMTGMPAWMSSTLDAGSDCFQFNCPVYALIVKSEQKLYLYIDGQLADVWLVSTGSSGHGTPDFDQHPNGRIYDRYSSTKFPGGDYNGLGNMPYAVFIRGGFAIHGTPQGNWKRLGSRASHGCIRVHPDNAFTFNRLVRTNGVNQTWITVRN